MYKYVISPLVLEKTNYVTLLYEKNSSNIFYSYYSNGYERRYKLAEFEKRPVY